MEYKETINKGLKRSYEVTVPSSEVYTLISIRDNLIQSFLLLLARRNQQHVG